MIRLIPLRGYFDVNAYFYIDDATGHGFLIDPGAQPDKVMSVVRRNGWTIEKILLTHGHFDHMGAASELRDLLGAEIYAFDRTGLMLQDAHTNLSALCGPAITIDGAIPLTDGETISLESDPLFPNLGDWILRTALEDAKKILRKKPDFVVNVNLSYVQLEQEDFTDKVWNALKTTGFPADHLCFEITERCRLLDMDLLRNVIITLRAGGVRIALDDFGTGYSSIGLMKSLPFDTIKIDRSFVQKIEEDDKERKLVNNLADAASIFGAKVCVEGIETSGMRDILREYGIHSFQGYYYSKPIAKEDVIEKYCV